MGWEREARETERESTCVRAKKTTRERESESEKARASDRARAKERAKESFIRNKHFTTHTSMKTRRTTLYYTLYYIPAKRHGGLARCDAGGGRSLSFQDRAICVSKHSICCLCVCVCVCVCVCIRVCMRV